MRILVLLGLVLIIAGCGTTATIHLRSGKNIEAKIERSSGSVIYLVDHPPVLRVEINDIDYPGDVAGIVGIVLGSAGWALAIWGFLGLVDCRGDFCYAPVIAAGIPGLVVAIPNTIVAIWGWVTYSESKSAAAPPDSAVPIVTPVALTDGERKYLGLGLGWRW